MSGWKTGEPWLLFDGNFMCHRAFHTTGFLIHNKMQTGTIFGVMKDISALMAFFNSTRAVIAFDHGMPKRRGLYPNYKRKRAGTPTNEQDAVIRQAFYIQVEMLKNEVLPKAGFKNVFFAEGYEADDVIAGVQRDIVGKKIIISADKDLYQLLAEDTTMYNPITKKIITVGEFVKLYGIKPSQWATVKAIAGCNSDNVDGVRGVGEKTAIRFLNQELPEKSATYQKLMLEESYEIRKRNMKLVKLPFMALPRFNVSVKPVDHQAWESVASEFGMETLKGRYKK